MRKCVDDAIRVSERLLLLVLLCAAFVVLCWCLVAGTVLMLLCAAFVVGTVSMRGGGR